MKKIKLLTAPYLFYNQFMPPVALGIISQNLLDNGIEHNKDDLNVRLYDARRKGKISLNNIKNNLDKWERYISGEEQKEVEKVVEQIIALTDIDGYDLFVFAEYCPPKSRIPDYILPAALYRFLKNKNKNCIIITNGITEGKYGLVDKRIGNIPLLMKSLKKEFRLPIDLKKKLNNQQNLDGFPIDMYNHMGVTVSGYFFFSGCPNNCPFCSDHSSFSGLPDPEKCVDNLADFIEKYKIRNFMFMNCTVNPTKKFALNFAECIIKSNLGIKWVDCANFNNMDFEVLDKLKEAGCIKLVFGFETASDSMQEHINKKLDKNHVERILKYCYEIGIWVDLTFLCGLPYETYKDLAETLEFIRENYIYIRGINLNRFILKDRSRFFIRPKKYGISVRNDKRTRGFDEIRGMNWEQKELYTQKVYEEMINAFDPARVKFTRPVNQIFRLFSELSPGKINSFLNSKVFDNNTKKIEHLIDKYNRLYEEDELVKSAG